MPKGCCRVLASLPHRRFALAKNQGLGENAWAGYGLSAAPQHSAVLAAPGLTAAAPCNAMISGLFQQGKCVPA